MKSKVTIKDIAQIVGISCNSVSKALRGSKSISNETRQKVLDIAESLGYIKDVHASSLRSGDSHVIAIVYDNLSNPYYTAMLQETTKLLLKTKYESMVFINNYSIGHMDENTAKRIASYGITGVITFIAPTSEANKILKAYKIPIVLIGRQAQNLEISSVYSDDYKGGKLAAKQLIELGGKSFLYVTEHAELDINTQRYEGFKYGLSKYNYVLDKEHYVVGNIENRMEDVLEKALKNDNSVDSIFCFSDIIAFEVIKKLAFLGYRVPEDINVIGYDNTKEILPYPLQVSSIDAQRELTAKIAWEILQEQINNTDNNLEPRYIKVDVVYSEGNTTSTK